MAEETQTGPEAPANITSRGLASQFAAQSMAVLTAPAAPAAPAAPPGASAPGTTDPRAVALQAAMAAQQAMQQAVATPPVAPPAPVAPKLDPATFAARFTDPQKAVTPPAEPVAARQVEPEPDPAQFVTQDGKPDKQAHAFAKLRYEAKIAAQQGADAARRAEEAIAAKEKLTAESAAAIEAKLAAERERDELREQLGKVSLAESPQFQEKYGLRHAEIEAKLAKALGKFAGITDQQAAVAKARDMLQASPERLMGLVDGLHPSVQGMALLAASESAALDEERQQELANWRQTSAALGVQEARAGAVRSIENRRQMAEEALAAATAVGNPVYASTDADARVVGDQVAEAFRGFAQTATEQQLMHAAAEGFAAPVLYQTITEQAARIAELEARVSAFDRARSVPMFPYQAPPPAPPAAPPPSNVVPVDPRDPMAAARRAASEAIAEFSRIGLPQGGR